VPAIRAFEKNLQKLFSVSHITLSVKFTCYRMNRIALVLSSKFMNEFCKIVLLICLKM